MTLSLTSHTLTNISSGLQTIFPPLFNDERIRPLFCNDTAEKTKTFIEAIEQVGEIHSVAQSSNLKALLQKMSQVSGNCGEVADEVHKACFKPAGYLSRLFSKESWSEWTERRTPLGRVLAAFQESLETVTSVKRLVRRLGQPVLKRAEKEAGALLRNSWVEMTSSCTTGVALGAISAAVTQSPIPLLMGLGSCLPGARADTLATNGTVDSAIAVGNSFPIGNLTSSSSQAPTMTDIGNGNFVVVWESGGQIFSSNGGSVGSPFQIGLNTNMNSNSTTIAALSNGDFVIAWQGLQESWCGVYAQIYDGTGAGSGDPFQVNTYSAIYQYAPIIDPLNGGYFAIRWHGISEDGASNGIFCQMFESNGAPYGNEFLITNYDPQNSPSVTMLNNGFFVVAKSNSTEAGSLSSFVAQVYSPSLQLQFSSSYSQAVITAIVTGSVSGGMSLLFFGIKIILNRLAAQNLQKALSEGESEIEKTQATFYKEVIRPITNRVFEKINTTDCFGYRSQEKTLEYLRAIGTVVGRAEQQGVDFTLKEMQMGQQNLMISEVVVQIERCCKATRGFLDKICCSKPKITPEMMEDAALAIALAVKADFYKKRQSLVLTTPPEFQPNTPLFIKVKTPKDNDPLI